MCADCLDAATDTVGRSYNKGKSFDSFREELIARSGDHYASWLTDLFSDPLVKEDIEYLLDDGRSMYILYKEESENERKTVSVERKDPIQR